MGITMIPSATALALPFLLATAQDAMAKKKTPSPAQNARSMRAAADTVEPVTRAPTTHKRSEEAWRHHAGLLEKQAQLLDLAQVMVLDLVGRIVRWNEGLTHLYGYTKQEAEGQIVHSLL